MMMDDLVEFFQICHSTDQPLCEQCKWEAVEKRKLKEANQEKDITNKRHSASQCKNLSNTDTACGYKWMYKENIYCFWKTD